MIGADLIHWKVAVVVDDGQVLRRVMEEMAGQIRLEQEVVFDEAHGIKPPGCRSGVEFCGL